ncbi:flp pilus-assembly TadE/G-like family protein [Gordonia cholesterolivorans]|uniref:Flp pilus-assembly TadE/G-like family protein n=2 Tax=Gordonia cholesterolivorans TaxID=559625 RepID=A0ABP5UUS8_9ACTN
MRRADRGTAMSVRGTEGDEGFSTVAGAAVIAGLGFLLVAMLYSGAAVVARHRAQSAADLSALAAAAVRVSGDGEACATARQLMSRQEGDPRMTGCVVDGDDVQLSVAVRVRLGRFGIREARAVARAGPVESP